jgi:hypothetical protein
MLSRDQILAEIKKIAEAKGGRPPGRRIFERETGIRTSEWHGVHWRQWGDALIEAGYEPNSKQGKLSSDEVLWHYANAVRHFGKIPAEIDVRMYAREHREFPSHSTFANHFGNKAGLVAAFAEWVRRQEEFADLIDILPEPVTPSDSGDGQGSESRTAREEGFVYLLKSGDHYKIGRSDDIMRRVKQIAVTLPEQVTLVHVIRTDDPAGIETYWHRRFAERRAKGEWFKLSIADVRAFKRRKFQ